MFGAHGNPYMDEIELLKTHITALVRVEVPLTHPYESDHFAAANTL